MFVSAEAVGGARSILVWTLLAVCCLTDFCHGFPFEPSLEILPSQSVQSKPVGSSLLLTCRPNVEEANLVTDLQWKDNHNRTIVEFRGKNRPPMYTERMPEGLSLSLYITSLTESMAGKYYCTASYANTQKLQATVTIDTIIAITWKDAPKNQFPIKGQDYLMKCAVSARPNPTVDWLRNDEQIEYGDRYVPHTNGLLIKNVQESDDGTYACRAAVIVTGELAERVIRLEVQIPPAIEQVPNEVEVLEGDTTTISCLAKGKPPPTYSWIKLSTQENLEVTDRFSVNKNTGVLTMTRVDQSDNGQYQCIANNNAGTAEAVIKVSVLVKPKIFEYINVTSPIKTETSIICKASGRPAPLIEFRKYGTKDYFVKGAQAEDSRIIVDQEVDPEKSETTGTLTFIDTRRSDDGLYECRASNKADAAFKNGHITVEYPPTFEASANQLPVWSWNQRPANLTCIAESIPNATIEWRRDNRILLEDQNIRIIGTGPKSILSITPLDRIYYTEYRCVATNRLGQAHHNIELRLATPPEGIIQSKLELVTATSVTFSIIGPAEATGLPIRAFVSQYKDDRNFDWNYALNKTWSVDSPYTIENLLPQTTYNFRFAALNEVGLGPWGSPQSQTMPRRSSPESPRLLTGSASETGAVSSPFADMYELRWKIPADNGEPIDFYELNYCPVHKVNGAWVETSEHYCFAEELKNYENTAYEISKLTPDTYYRIRLKAHNLLGYSLPGEMFIRTARGANPNILSHEGPALTSAAIIGIVIGGVVLMLIVVDVLLCCCRKQGVLATICHRKSKKHEEDEAKLGRDEKEPLKECNDRVMIDNSMMRNTSVEFDGRRVHAKTGDIIGKNSAV